MPYKFSRLKKGYLLLIVVALFTISLYATKIVFNSVINKEETEEKSVGDVNETMDYPFEVRWDDKDFESNRPSSITYNLYNVLDENTVVSTVTLTPSNVDTEDPNKWNGTFTNIRKYNDDETEASYIIKQQSLNNYIQKYDVKEPDTVCVEFGNNVFGGDTTKSIKLMGVIRYIYHYSSSFSYETWDYFNTINKRTGDTDFYYEDLANKTICTCAANGEKNIYFQGDDVTLDIKNIYTARRGLDKDDSSTWADYSNTHMVHDLQVVDEYLGKNYPTTLRDGYTRYTWDSNYSNIPGANVITNNYNKINLKFDAYWEDEGHESNRPTSSEYYLYRKDNQNNIVKTITLTNSNADPNDSNHWIGSFDNVDAFDLEGNKIEYVVRQKDTPNYINSYDSNEGYSITFNENAITGYYAALQLFFYDDINDIWRQFNYEEYDGIGKVISGKTINAKFENEYNLPIYDTTYGAPSRYSRADLRKFETHQIEKFVGNNYPESPHPIIYYEDFSYEYRYSLSNHTQKMYLFYSGASWGGQYGIKIDSIKTIGNETIVTSRYNVRSLDITKKWEDEGHENERPSTTIVDIYDAKKPDQIVRTVEITPSDRVDDYTWKKTIQNLPIYDSDLQEIEYLIKERTVDGYKAIYDFDEYYNALAIQFGPNADIYGAFVSYHTKNSNGEDVLRDVYCSGYSYCTAEPDRPEYDKISNRTVYVPKREFEIYVDAYNRYKFNVEDITLVHIDNYGEDFYNSGNSMSRKILISSTTYEDYPSLNYRFPYNIGALFKYTWNGSTVPRKNASIIINKYDKTSYEFTKEWDDVGNEDNRPTSIRYNIYNELDENTVVKSLTLTSSNENPDNRYEWNGIFTGIPKYNSDMSIAKYVVKEETLDKYQTSSRYEYNRICIKFGNNVFSDDPDRSIHFYVGNKNSMNEENPFERMYLLKNENLNSDVEIDNTYFYKNDLQNKDICLPVENGFDDFYIIDVEQKQSSHSWYYYTGNLTNLDIVDIYRSYDTNNYHLIKLDANLLMFYPSLEFNNNTELPNITEMDKFIHYKWEGNFRGKQIITNVANMRQEGYIKEFVDEGVEYNRPKEIVFGLFVDDDPIPKEMTTLHTSTCINNKCNIEFKNVKDKDSDGNPISYIIKEISDYGYTVTYEDDKVINTANPVNVKFRKENIGHDILRGAKFEIYNKSGDKIIEFISKDTETTIKLIPSEYVVKEVEAPTGYSRSQDITFTVNENGTVVIDGKTENVVNIVNEPLKEKYDITIKKTLKTNETKDFTFEISITDFNGVLEYVGDRGGTITFNNNKATVNIGYNQTITIKDIPTGSKYEIKELGDDYLITVVGNNKGTLNRNEYIEFINEPKEVPANGEEKEVPTPITGVFNILSYIAGILLLLLSVFLIYYSKKQMKRR